MLLILYRCVCKGLKTPLLEWERNYISNINVYTGVQTVLH